MRAGFWWGNLQERDHLKTPGVDGYSRSGMRGRGLYIYIWFRKEHVAGSCDCSNKMQGISGLTENIAVSHEEVCSTDS